MSQHDITWKVELHEIGEPYFKAAAFISVEDDGGEFVPLAVIGRTSPKGKLKLATRLTKEVPWIMQALKAIKAWPGLLGGELGGVRKIKIDKAGKVRVITSSPSSFVSSLPPQEEESPAGEEGHSGQ